MSLFLPLIAASFAAEPEFAETDKSLEEAEAVQLKLSAEAGASWTTGNTDFYTGQGTLMGSARWSANKVSAQAGALYGKGYADLDADGVLGEDERKERLESARRFFADARYDRFLNDKNSLYVLGGALQDRFAGYDRRTHEQLGYSRVLVASATTHAVAELGVDFAQEDYVAGVDPSAANILAGRVMLGMSQAFNERVGVAEQVEVYENVLDLADLRVLNTASLNVGLSQKLSLKLSHQLLFDNVPVSGFQKLDQTTMLTLVVGVL